MDLIKSPPYLQYTFMLEGLNYAGVEGHRARLAEIAGGDGTVEECLGIFRKATENVGVVSPAMGILEGEFAELIAKVVLRNQGEET